MESFNLKAIILPLVYIFLFLNMCYAQEEITITTYYPSPYGIYDELEANNSQADRVAVGDGNDPTVVGDGVLDFVALAAAPAGNAGSIYYDAAGGFMFNDGVTWQPLAASPAQLIFYSDDDPWAPPDDCVPVGTHVVAILDTTLRGASMQNPPADGFILCH